MDRFFYCYNDGSGDLQFPQVVTSWGGPGYQYRECISNIIIKK